MKPELFMQDFCINLYSGAHGARKLADGVVSGVHEASGQCPLPEAGPSVLSLMDVAKDTIYNEKRDLWGVSFATGQYAWPLRLSAPP